MPGTIPDTAILVFARAPVAGATKTRLIPLLGATGDAALHTRLVTHALATARTAAPARIELWCAPDAAHPFLQSAAAAQDATLHVQRGDNLGDRMAHALADALQRSTYALCIGTDCPALHARHLHDAAAALNDGSDAVFAPTEDGGYALIGLASARRQLFDNIDWGGPQVMAQTRTRLGELGLRWHELDTLWDVDRPEDVLRLQQSGLLPDAPVRG
jgi:rSAM/selenodomain-associated transferase 1